MSRYALLFHDHPFPHWDLLLEADDELRTWRLLEEPAPGRTVPAEPLAPHRKMYLDYEGPVSGRGTVVRCEGGTFEVVAETQARFEVVLLGGTRPARVVLKATGDPTRWVAEFRAADGTLPDE